jgi:hypothetical protein
VDEGGGVDEGGVYIRIRLDAIPIYI